MPILSHAYDAWQFASGNTDLPKKPSGYSAHLFSGKRQDEAYPARAYHRLFAGTTQNPATGFP